jgi:tRNA (guanine37-N1)-methyltransferase
LLKITILTGLPEYVESALTSGHLRIARHKGAVDLRVVNLRDFAQDAYRTIDDEPYGGGGGMVLKADVVWRALESAGVVCSREGNEKPPAGSKGSDGPGEDSRGLRSDGPEEQYGPWVILPTPKGRRLTQKDFERWSRKEHLVFLCSRYKGIDERIRAWVDEERSLGDYVIGGGEAAVLVMMEGVVRLLGDVVGEPESVSTDSHTSGLLSAPAYTRPEEFRGECVPKVLLSGHHAEIKRWRRKKAIQLTLARRPDMLARMQLDEDDMKLLLEVLVEQDNRS